MFDLTDQNWKHNIKKWKNILEDNTAEAFPNNFKRHLIEVILVGNKSDIAEGSAKTVLEGE